MSSAEPLVSVIIPAFNAKDYIAETLESVLAQTHRNIEIIVVDDGSTDGTSQIVQNYRSPVQYFFQENSGGCAVPRNTGIKNSSGVFLCFIDADDVMLPDRISRQVDLMERHPNLGLVFCDYRNFDETGPCRESHFQTCPLLLSRLGNRKEAILENPCALLARENIGIAGSFLVRRSLLDLESGFEPSLRSCEDFHFYFRVASHAPVGIVNEVGLMRRVHGENMSCNVVRMRFEGIRSRTMLRESEKNPAVRASLGRYIISCKIDLARYFADHGKYVQSLRYGWKALSDPSLWREKREVCRNMLRTIAMAAGLHRPRENEIVRREV